MNINSLINRIKNILLTPSAEWNVINSESTSVADLFKFYIVPLALIGPVAGFIGNLIFTGQAVVAGVITAAISYILNLAAVYVVSLIIDLLAPSFSGTKNPVQALKAITYSSTPGWIAGVFLIVPVIGIIAALAGLYGLYLLYLGLPKMMKVPQEKALVYTIVVIILTIVIFAIPSVLAGMLTVMLTRSL